MIIINSKRKDKLEAGVGVKGRAAVFKTKSLVDGPSLVTQDGDLILESASGKKKTARHFTPLRSSGWQHPWSTSVDYYDIKSGKLLNSKGEAISGWGARIKPGFVNGIDPIVRAAAPLDLGLDPTKPQRTPEQRMRAVLRDSPGLADNPLIPCFPQIAKKTNEIPKQLRDMGAVGLDKPIKASGSGLNTTYSIQGNLEGISNERYVAIQYFHIAVARPSFKMEVDIGQMNLILGQGIGYNVGYDTRAMDLFGVRARLNGGLPEKKPEPTFEERLQGGYGDDGQDFFMVSAVYWLSQEAKDVKKSAKDGKPELDSTWVPFVRHFCFWNLEYRTKMEFPRNLPRSGVDPFLAWFVGRFTIAPMATMAAMASEENRVLAAAFNNALPKGYFWTI